MNYGDRWSSTLSVGVPKMDEQHQAILDCLVQVGEAGTAPESSWKLERACTELEETVKRHFAAEEKLLQAVESRELIVQIAQHRYFEREIAHFAARCRKGFVMGIETLRDWFIAHVAELDVRYGSAFRGEPSLAPVPVREADSYRFSDEESPLSRR